MAQQGRPTRYRVLSIAKLPFLDELTAACAACDRAQTLPAEERNRQVEDAFFRAAVALETFLSEWLIRCLSFDSTRVHQRAEKELHDWVGKQVGALGGVQGRRYAAFLAHQSSALSIPRRLMLKDALALFGAGDDVVAVRGSKDLEKKAKNNLINTYAVRAMQLTARQQAFLDGVKKIRNALAHGSPGAVSAMNVALRSAALPATVRRGSYGVARSGVGGYLSARASDQRRYAIFFNELARIADALCKSQGRPRTISSAA